MPSTNETELRLTRKQLAELFKNNPVAIRAFENLFKTTSNVGQVDISSLELNTDVAYAKALEAFDLIAALIKDTALSRLSPPYEHANSVQLDIAPRYEAFQPDAYTVNF